MRRIRGKPSADVRHGRSGRYRIGSRLTTDASYGHIGTLLGADP